MFEPKCRTHNKRFTFGEIAALSWRKRGKSAGGKGSDRKSRLRQAASALVARGRECGRH